MNLYLFQPQYTFSVNNRDTYWLPYSIGCLWAYAKQFEQVQQNWNLQELGFRRKPIQDIVDAMDCPDMVGLSVYIWNRNYCKALGEAIKTRWPNSVIFVGGPMVNGGWSRYPWVDSIIIGEGERSFVELLKTVANKQPPELYYKMPRMETLSGVPSPYSSGVFDDLVRQHPDFYWNITIETNRGCPYQCTFCDWGGLTGSKMKKFDLERIQEELDWIVQQKVGSIFIADSNLGMFFERDKHIAKMIRAVADKTGIDYVASNYAKNSDERLLEIADILGETNKGLTFSVQSMNPDTLKVIKRHNLKTSDAKYLFELSARKKLQYYTELMLGLPLETKESWMQGLADLLELGQHNHIIMIPVVPLENTELGDIQLSEYGIRTVDVADGFRYIEDKNSQVVETWPWVCETNTMSTQDIIDSWLYGWMITNFHTNSGYSMLLSKYCRHVLNVSYRHFYDAMWKNLNENADTVVHQQYRLARQIITEIYTTGSSSQADLGAHNLLDYCQQSLNENYFDTAQFCIQIAESFGRIDPGIEHIQKRWVQNQFYQTPYIAYTKFNIETWQTESSVYEITKPLEQNAIGALAKRGKKLLNTVRLMPKPLTQSKLLTISDSVV